MIIKIEESFSGIDIALTKRYDVLIKMIDVVKSYSKHEKETIFEVIKLRKNMTLEEKRKVNASIDDNFRKVNVIVENYPELKSSENYKSLQQSIMNTEKHLQAARRLYNSNVSSYNQQIVSFPVSIIAKIKGIEIKDFFKTDEIKKEDINIVL